MQSNHQLKLDPKRSGEAILNATTGILCEINVWIAKGFRTTFAPICYVIHSVSQQFDAVDCHQLDRS